MGSNLIPRLEKRIDIATTNHQKPVTCVYFNIYRVCGGRIHENWAEYGRMSMAEQLGFQVTPPSTPQYLVFAGTLDCLGQYRLPAMCGRYARRSDKQRIAELFAVHDPVIPNFGPSWNVAPQTFQPVVRLNRDTGEREIVLMRWGLIPYWTKDPSIGLRTINAKAETITTAPAFREAIKHRRCLVPADAFYEWQKLDAKTKHPFAIAMKDAKPYALAGLWERWKDQKAGPELLTFTIITTDPNEIVQPLHYRMPVIIPERDYDRWLKPDPERPPIDLLRPFDADKMTTWRVDKAVGDVKNDRPELIEPAPPLPEQLDDPPPELPGLLFRP